MWKIVVTDSIHLDRRISKRMPQAVVMENNPIKLIKCEWLPNSNSVLSVLYDLISSGVRSVPSPPPTRLARLNVSSVFFYVKRCTLSKRVEGTKNGQHKLENVAKEPDGMLWGLATATHFNTPYDKWNINIVPWLFIYYHRKCVVCWLID